MAKKKKLSKKAKKNAKPIYYLEVDVDEIVQKVNTEQNMTLEKMAQEFRIELLKRLQLPEGAKLQLDEAINQLDSCGVEASRSNIELVREIDTLNPEGEDEEDEEEEVSEVSP